MNSALYDMIYKRKSFHLFRGIGDVKLTEAELAEIGEFISAITPLCPDIKTAVRIVPAEEVTNRHGQEYCAVFYSEKRGNYLQNVGYMGQQLDLYFASRDIAACWYGIGKAKEETFEGLDYVIMIAFSKTVPGTPFRKDMFKAKRKSLQETWKGELLPGVSNIARFAPSACNSQPWRVENTGGEVNIYRYKKPGLIGIMTPEHAKYFNRIDMGIYLCILELCLQHEGVAYTLDLRPDEGTDEEMTLSAVVKLG